jgi:hypothetical protein
MSSTPLPLASSEKQWFAMSESQNQMTFITSWKSEHHNDMERSISIQIDVERITIAHSSLRNAPVCFRSASRPHPAHDQRTSKFPQLEKYNDFDIIVGTIHYHCPWHAACFISPRICQEMLTDGSFCEFHIEIEDPNNLFKIVLSLASGESLSVTSNNRCFYESVFTELGNAEVIVSILKQFDENLTISTVIDKVISLSGIYVCCD